MNLLHYKITWIDDQPASAKNYFENIKARLGRLGFDATVEWVSNSTMLEGFLNRLSRDQEQDVIMVDWKLGQMVPNGQTGTSVASKIRMYNQYATIIFYSAESPDVLRGEIAKQRIDGVYCVNRTNFIDEAMNIIKASIRKFSDLNSMRGLFLAAVAEFDHLIQESVLKAYQGLPTELQQPVKEKLLNKTSKYLQAEMARIEKIDKTADLSTVLAELRAGSKQVVDCLISILSLGEPSQHHVEALRKFKGYESDVMTPRNDMAHVRASIKAGVPCIERNDRKWDATKFSQLRLVLMEHYENFSHINNSLVEALNKHLSEKNAIQIPATASTEDA